MSESRPLNLSPSELVAGTAGSAYFDSPTVVPAPAEPERGGNGGIRLVYGAPAGDNPFAEMAAGAAPGGGVRGGANAYGAFSLETFATAGGLTYTHEDAAGWYNYVAQFTAPNFWYKDANVRIWSYYETYDNWLDTYGLDAVNAVYHSGHGGRLADGRWWAPLGADWGGQGTNAWSDQMRLGNEHANYIFWSTCFSCPVYAPLNPITTWGAANLGFRMLFGFETTSVDDPNYGAYFWQEWNNGKSFSTAWLDASWRISQGQVPSVVACGADATEAQDRLFNERYFYWPHVSTNYWWWRWYDASSLAPAGMMARERQVTLPQQLLVAQLRPVEVTAQTLRATVDRFGLRLRLPGEVMATRAGTFKVSEGDMRLAFGEDGSVEAQMARPNRANRSQIALGQAAAAAQDALGLYGLARDVQLVFDRVQYAAEGGGSNQGSGELQGPFVTATTVQFKQLINGLPVVTPGAGEVRVTVDNDGQVTHVYSSTRTIDRLREGERSLAPTPEGGEMPRGGEGLDHEQRLGEVWAQQMARWVVRGRMPVGYSMVPGTTEVGYAVRGNQATLVAQREIEVNFGNGLFKRYRVQTPLGE